MTLQMIDGELQQCIPVEAMPMFMLSIDPKDVGNPAMLPLVERVQKAACKAISLWIAGVAELSEPWTPWAAAKSGTSFPLHLWQIADRLEHHNARQRGGTTLVHPAMILRVAQLNPKTLDERHREPLAFIGHTFRDVLTAIVFEGPVPAVPEHLAEAIQFLARQVNAPRPWRPSSRKH